MSSSLKDLEEVLGRHSNQFDEPESLQLIAAARDSGLLTEADWGDVQQWLHDALINLAETATLDEDTVFLDADYRNADWVKIVRARRITEHDIPSWAALWLWWISFRHVESKFWAGVRTVCRDEGIPNLRAV